MRPLRIASLALALSLVVSSGVAAAAEPWSEPGARTLPRGHLELGLLSASALGLTDNLELRIHPLAALAFPQVTLKARWLNEGTLHFAATHQLAYPRPFLSLVSREGTGGLLPPGQDVGHGLLATNGVLVSSEWAKGQFVTTGLGLTIATATPFAGQPFDFPFLFQRLGALGSGWVPEARLVASGRCLTWLGYELGAEGFFHLPRTAGQPNTASALEGWAELFALLGERHRISASLRVSDAQLPVGERTHWLPTLDYRIRLDLGGSRLTPAR